MGHRRRVQDIAGLDVRGTLPLCRRDPFQYRRDGRAIRRAGPYVMQGDGAGRIDQDVPAALGDIPRRLLDFPALQDLLQVCPPGFRTPYVPKGSGDHPVGPICLPRIVHEKGPGQPRFFHVRAREETGLERDHHDSDVSLPELLFPITQLRDVRAAGESAEVAVEHHQQPIPAVLLEVVDSSGTVTEPEGDGGFSGQVIHRVFTLSR